MFADQRTPRGQSMWPVVRLVAAVLLIAVLISTLFERHGGGSSSGNEASTQLQELQQQVKLLQEMVAGGRHLGRSPPPKASKERARVEVDESRKIYGGKGDAPHLGGFTESDLDGVSPALWTFLMKHINVKSVIDLGCGRGISTKWFMDHGADVLCVEGSQDALDRTVLPKEKIVHHDVYMGPWWPDRTYDLMWSVELLEHIGRHKMDNYLPMMQRSGVLFLTASQWGGWHHVEVHKQSWWVTKFTSLGFVYSKALTKKMRDIAAISQETHAATHLIHRSFVFLNPVVLSKPQHMHLFGGHGCFKDYDTPEGWDCKEQAGQFGVTEFDVLSPEWKPLMTEPTKYDADIIKIWHSDN